MAPRLKPLMVLSCGGRRHDMYRFGEFTLDVRTRRLLRGEQEIHLSPKAFDLLALLVEHRAQAMSKSDLQKLLWPSTYVLETNLAGLVAEIRRVLEDPADDPRFIRTVQRFGYWFVGSVAAGGAGTADGAARVRYWLLWDTRQIPLEPGENIVGRAPDAAVWIDAPGVSRHHARIRLDGAAVTLEDLGSKNGTYLHGERVAAPSPLSDGDQIQLGSVVVTFRIPPPAASTETARP
jgi:DNA-binding winged helix-turn-helix (wHTH) protein